jgi:DNA-binding transcriptional LysR family regulator
MVDRLSGIAVFVQAVEAGSFARTAERMHLSRSAVAKSIARLEERLGVRLFHRTTRSQSLTDEGQAYYERCLRALDELESGEAAVNAGRSVPSGRVRLSMPVLFGRRCVAPVLVRLAQRYPALELTVSFTDRVVDLVDEGVDLVIRSGPLLDSSGIVARRLGVQEASLYAAPAYLTHYGEPLTIADLESHRAILYGRGNRDTTLKIRDEDGRLRDVVVSHQLRFDDLEAIAEAALDGAGLARLPSWSIAEHVAQGRLVPVLKEASRVTFDMHLMWLASRHLPQRLRVVIDELMASVPSLLTES